MKLNALAPGLLVAIPLLWVGVVHAQIDNPSLIPDRILNPSCNFMTGEFAYSCIPLYVAYMIQTVFSFIGTICLIQLIYGGYEIAIGNLTGNTEEGKKRIRNALIGLAVSIFSFAIIDMIVAVVVP